MLFLQHPVLVLVFKQLLCHCLARRLGQETALWTTICPISGSGSSAATVSHLLLQALFTESLHGKQPLAPPPLLWYTQSTLPSLLSVLFSSLFIIQVFFVVLFCVFVFAGWGSVCPGDYAGLSQGWLWEYWMLLICSPVGLDLPNQVWSQHLAVWEPSWFLSVRWYTEAFCRLGVQVVRVLLILGVFFPSKCGSSVSARFLIYRSHATCFLPLITILDLLNTLYVFFWIRY
jgi:hypothetical protein